MRFPNYTVGHNALTGKPVSLRADELKVHGLFVGGTRRGKSKLLEGTSRYMLASGIPHVVLDPAGDTVKDIMKHATYRRLESKVIYIDVNQAVDTSVFPLNFLQPMGLDAATHASHIMKAIAKVFREEISDTKPRLERRERATLMALIEAGYTLSDMLDFLSIENNRFRQQVLRGVSDRYVQAEWSEFDSISRRSDRETILESVLNRAAKIILNEPVRRCLGTANCGLDWDSIVRDGKTVLVNLQPRLVSRECMELIGTLIIDYLVRYGTQREEPLIRPLYLLCDELDELATPDLGYAMQALAKRGIYIWGFVQYLEQLRDRKETSRLYHSIMANSDLKVAFHTSYEDAKLLVRELFAGSFKGDITKHEIYHTVQIPVESVRTVLTQSQSASTTEAESSARGSSSSFSSLDSSSSGIGHADLFGVSDGFGPTPLGSSDTLLSGSVSGSVDSSGDMESESRSVSESRAQGKSESIIPFYEFIERQELSSQAYYTVEEIVEQYIAYIQCQPQRHAQIKLGDQQAIPIVTAFVETPKVRTKDVARLVERSNTTYGLKPIEVDVILDRRREVPRGNLLPSEPESDDDRWQ